MKKILTRVFLGSFFNMTDPFNVQAAGKTQESLTCQGIKLPFPMRDIFSSEPACTSDVIELAYSVRTEPYIDLTAVSIYAAPQ